MKKKMITLAVLVVALGSTSVFAQKGVDDGSRFGHGEDSLRCLQNLSMYAEYVKTGNFKDAYLPWKVAYTECPAAQNLTYTNGVKILHWFVENEKDATKRAQYMDELMGVYEQRIKYLDQLNSYVKKPVSEGSIRGSQAHDFYAYNQANLDVNKAYEMLGKAIEMEKENTTYYVLQDYMDVSARKYKADANHREKFIEDYQMCAAYIDGLLQDVSPRLQQVTETAKNNIDAYFINSGAATCENLQEMYAPKVEANKDNMEYLKKVVSLMRMFKCTDQEAYFKASEYAHNIAPTAETAVGCAYMYYKKDNLDKAVEFFDQAIALEEDDDKKSEDAYNVAVVLFSKKQLSRAKSYIHKSLSFNGNNGKAYILLANMYASSPKWNDEPALNRCTYYVCIDKLQRAKAVDPSVTEEANKLIGTYAQHTPKTEDLFFLGMKKGDTVTVGGWISESTVIR